MLASWCGVPCWQSQNQTQLGSQAAPPAGSLWRRRAPSPSPRCRPPCRCCTRWGRRRRRRGGLQRQAGASLLLISPTPTQCLPLSLCNQTTMRRWLRQRKDGNHFLVGFMALKITLLKLGLNWVAARIRCWSHLVWCVWRALAASDSNSPTCLLTTTPTHPDLGRENPSDTDLDSTLQAKLKPKRIGRQAPGCSYYLPAYWQHPLTHPDLGTKLPLIGFLVYGTVLYSALGKELYQV